MADPIFVPADLFELCMLDSSARAPRARRLLVTMWLFNPGTSRRSEIADVAEARAVWQVVPHWLDRASRVTVLSVLLQLKQIDFVQAVDPTADGYLVSTREEARCA